MWIKEKVKKICDEVLHANVRRQSRLRINSLPAINTQGMGREVKGNSKRQINGSEEEDGLEELRKIIGGLAKSTRKLATGIEGNTNQVIILDPELSAKGKNMEWALTKCPEIEAVVKGGLTLGQIKFAKSVIETTKLTENTTHILPFKIHREGMNDVPQLYELLPELKKQTVVKGDGEQTSPNRPENQEGKADEDTFMKRKPPVEKLVVKAGGRTYAELLKTVKTNTDVERARVQVRKLKKTAKGDLLLETAGEKPKSKIFPDDHVKAKQKSGGRPGQTRENEIRVETLLRYKCLGFGHRAKECNGPDRTEACLSCGEAGHRAMLRAALLWQ
ncbi:hypothetical protein ILUMI_04019 [Ignelater luminosus]|uniref:CCHC-type domain-containing protein n=1 Tax=Ignelater luminosus TaxID=2038154 RepID=A0A8K0GJY3_IGNLU|nr:hypothetical protein ILUMI_04019 [Ignelater luminosus]